MFIKVGKEKLKKGNDDQSLIEHIMELLLKARFQSIVLVQWSFSILGLRAFSN